jgi:hypothetical protein
MRLAELVNHQQKQIKEMEQMHNLEKEAKEKEGGELKVKIKELQAENKLCVQDIEELQWKEIDEKKETNKDQLAQLITTGMKSKGELTQSSGDWRTQKTRKESSEKENQEKQSKLNDLTNFMAELKQQITTSEKEL